MQYIEYTTKSGNTGKRRLNPNTGTLFKKGDMLEDGSIFIGYDSNITALGYFIEKWKRPKGHKKEGIQPRAPKDYKKYKYNYNLFERTCRAKKSFCLKHNLPFDLTPEYLMDIYPGDLKCPIFNIEMEEASEIKDKVPNLDRIIPLNGYVKCNVQWISARANRIKSDASLQELEKIVAYLRKNNT
jgi:hypothetical protein